MFTFETMLVLGLILIAGSILTLAAAHYARHWFFNADEQLTLQPVRANRDPRY